MELCGQSRENSASMCETPRKPCNATCRCCNSPLGKTFDRIDLFGKTAQKENLVEKLKEIGGIEVLEEDVSAVSTLICRKCFRKVVGLDKAVHAFRDMCLNSKIQNEKVRQKRGRNPFSPTVQDNPEKRLRQSSLQSDQFTVRHFDKSAIDRERNRPVDVSERVSLFPLEEQTFTAREIQPLVTAAEKETKETPQRSSKILQGAGLRNPEVGLSVSCKYSFDKKASE